MATLVASVGDMPFGVRGDDDLPGGVGKDTRHGGRGNALSGHAAGRVEDPTAGYAVPFGCGAGRVFEFTHGGDRIAIVELRGLAPSGRTLTFHRRDSNRDGTIDHHDRWVSLAAVVVGDLARPSLVSNTEQGLGLDLPGRTGLTLDDVTDLNRNDVAG